MMATSQQMDATYNYMDEIFRLSLGETADITCALYNGDFSKTLEQAQRDKHDYILDAVLFRAGSRLLDIGCGWGPMLEAAKKRGGQGIGLTLSTKHAEACRRNGLEAYVQDWKDITVETFGKFDSVISLGAFEHFCSVEEYQAGKQDGIYDHFFRLCSELLPTGGKLYLQTVMWGKNALPYEKYSLNASKDSNEHILAVLEKFYPGTWLPMGEEQLLRTSAPYFEVISMNNGRKDYVETSQQWRVIWKFSWRKMVLAIKILPDLLRDKDFRYRLETLRRGYMGESLKREVMDHQRIVFQKK
jgi:cyclopropane-fatty-acyl-phospholipid synthase